MARRKTKAAERVPGPLLLSAIFLIASSAYGQIRQPKKVLLMEDDISAPAVETIARSFEADLTAKSLNPIDFYRESLDNILIPEGNYQADIRKWYERKYANRKVDLIVTIGTASHNFIETEHERLFRGVPVVFCLDFKPESETAQTIPNSTGVWLDFDPVSTVNVARQLLPTTKRVAVIAGNGFFDLKLTDIVKKKLAGYKGVEFDYLTGIDLATLLKDVRNLPQDTAILYLTMTKDRYERHMFVRYNMPLLSATADVPMFGLIDLGVGSGFVGGHVTSFSDGGPIAAEIAARILGGANPESIPPITAPNLYSFDWKQLHRWGLDASRLPPGSIVRSRQPSVFQQYKHLILAVLAVLLLLLGLVIYLLIERAKRHRVQLALEQDIVERKKAEEALTDLSRRLLNAQEEERSRIARELHDDFSQRLAVLAINLETAALALPKDPEQAAGRIHNLSELTGDIGADLHRLCRNLHSSVLDVLGLAGGLGGLCDEFKEQGLQVELTCKAIPHELSASTSLCFYRIAQEALSNVKKHSGVQKAFVAVEGNGKQITMKVIDKGSGFDPRESAFSVGLGLRSMQERMRAVGGTVDILSGRGRGTQISARAPVA